MDKAKKALEIIQLTRPLYEDFEEFHKEKPGINRDDFAEVVAFMHGRVLAKRLELTPADQKQVFNGLMKIIIDEISITAANEK